MTTVERLGKRWGRWRFVLIATLFWILLWPVGIGWLLVSALRRYQALDHSPAAKTSRRIDRFLSWYPAQWRARYGDELAQLLRETIESGRGGTRLTLNMVRESAAARGDTVGAICWSLCWIPLVPQGVVPLVLKLTGVPTRSWFLATYVPAPVQWPTIVAMLAVGLAMLVTAVRLLPAHLPKATASR